MFEVLITDILGGVLGGDSGGGIDSSGIFSSLSCIGSQAWNDGDRATMLGNVNREIDSVQDIASLSDVLSRANGQATSLRVLVPLWKSSCSRQLGLQTAEEIGSIIARSLKGFAYETYTVRESNNPAVLSGYDYTAYRITGVKGDNILGLSAFDGVTTNPNLKDNPYISIGDDNWGFQWGEKDNTMLYVAGGLGVVVLYLLFNKKKKR